MALWYGKCGLGQTMRVSGMRSDFPLGAMNDPSHLRNSPVTSGDNGIDTVMSGIGRGYLRLMCRTFIITTLKQTDIDEHGRRLLVIRRVSQHRAKQAVRLTFDYGQMFALLDHVPQVAGFAFGQHFDISS